jgi:hypothetical protein
MHSCGNGHTVNDRFANLLVITWNIRSLVSSHIRHARRLTVNFRKSHPHKIGCAPEDTSMHLLDRVLT